MTTLTTLTTPTAAPPAIPAPAPSPAPPLTLHRALSEPWTHALLQWPALLGLLPMLTTPTIGWTLPTLLGLWLLAMLASTYRRGGLGFGNALVLADAGVGLAWWLHPAPWAYAVLAGVALVMLAAQGVRVRAVGV